MLVYRVRSETGGHIYIYMMNVKCVLTWPCLYRPWRSVPYSVLDDHALGSGWGSRGRWPTSHVGWAWPSSWSVGIYYGSYNGPIIIPSFGSVFHSYMTLSPANDERQKTNKAARPPTKQQTQSSEERRSQIKYELRDRRSSLKYESRAAAAAA